MNIVFTEKTTVKIINMFGVEFEKTYNVDDVLEVQHIRCNRAMNTSVILLKDGSTIHGLSQTVYELY